MDIWQHVFGAGLDLTASRARGRSGQETEAPAHPNDWRQTWAQMAGARLGLSVLGAGAGLFIFRWPYNLIFAAWHLCFMQSKFAYTLVNTMLYPKGIVAAGILSQGGLILGAYAGLKYFGAPGFVAAFVLERLIEAIVLWIALFHREPPLRQKIISCLNPGLWIAPLKRWMLLEGGLTIWVAQLLGVLVARTDNVLIGRMLGYTSLAYYSLAFRSMEAPLFIFGAIADGSLAYFVRHQEERHVHYAKAMQAALAAGIGCAMALTAFGFLLAEYTFGDQYRGVGPLVAFSAWTLVPRGLNMISSSLLLATHRERLMLVSSAAGLAANITGNLILIPIWGVWGAPACAILSECLTAAIRAHQGIGLRLTKNYETAFR